MVIVFEELGVRDLAGLEGSPIDVDVAHVEPSLIQIRDVSKPFQIDRQFDLAVCLEVAEHLPEDSAGDFIRSLTHLSPLVLFSAAVPGQGGVGHLNEQWPQYWADRFSQCGFEVRDCLRDQVWTDRRVEWWYRQNLLLFLSEKSRSNYPLLDQATSLRKAQLFEPSLDRKMPLALQQPEKKVLPGGQSTPVSVTIGVVSAGGPKKLTACLQSIAKSGFADEIVVCLDKHAPDGSREAAMTFTSQIYNIESQGYVESVLPQLAAHCSGEYLLRLDDDECLSGEWTRAAFDGLARINDVTHFQLCRRWIVPPGDMFLASRPWFPDLQLRLFRNDPRIIRWPKTIHEPMSVSGHSIVLTDRWIDHWELVCSSRPEREKKCEYYRTLRPEHHLSEFYLYEDGQFKTMKADSDGFLSAVLSSVDPLSRPGYLYIVGQEVDARSGGNSHQFLGRGWSHQEPWGRWSEGEEADICFFIQEPFDQAAVLTVQASAFLAPSSHPTVSVEVEYNKRRVAVWVFDQPGNIEKSAIVPEEMIVGQRSLVFTFRISNPVSPYELGQSADPRRLGLGLTTLRLDRI